MLKKLLGICVCVFMLVGTAQAEYQLIDIGALDLNPTAEVATSAKGLSPDGTLVVGWSVYSGTSSKAAIWRNSGGTWEIVDPGAAKDSVAYGANDAGQVAIADRPGTKRTIAIWTSTGGLVDLGTLGGARAQACGITASGHIGGCSWTSTSSKYHLCLWDGTTLNDLGMPTGQVECLASDINDSDEMACWAKDSTAAQSAFQYSGGTFTQLWLNGRASGINSLGDVVGYSGTDAMFYDASAGTVYNLGAGSGNDISDDGNVIIGASGGHACMWTNPGTWTRTDLNDLVSAPRWDLTNAERINALGWIVGDAQYDLNNNGLFDDSFLRAYLLVPEPSTLALLLLGGMSLAWIAARRR